MRHGLLARHDLTAQASTFRSRGKGRATGPHTASPVEVCGAGWAHVIGLCMRVARRSPVPPLRRSAPCVCRAAVLRSPPVPLAATRNGPLCVCVPYNPAHTVGVQLVRKGPLELGAGGGAARAPQAAVSAAAHHRVRDRRAEGERRAARLGAGARRGRSTRCVRGGYISSGRHLPTLHKANRRGCAWSWGSVSAARIRREASTSAASGLNAARKWLHRPCVGPPHQFLERENYLRRGRGGRNERNCDGV